ncbi:MAG: hypothetical protein HFJ25_01920 [Clostridia bacterium]|nr:hypothetical protein [Clostridia bacterium]
MIKNDELLEKLLNIETTIEEIYKEIIKIRKENDDKVLEQIHVMTRLENIADFIKTRYNVVVEEKAKFVTEMLENNDIV